MLLSAHIRPPGKRKKKSMGKGRPLTDFSSSSGVSFDATGSYLMKNSRVPLFTTGTHAESAVQPDMFAFLVGVFSFDYDRSLFRP